MTDISTSGWDVVNITDLDTINTIINTDRVYPSEFSVSDSILGTEININGKWGRWTVSSNTCSGSVNARCEIAEG